MLLAGGGLALRLRLARPLDVTPIVRAALPHLLRGAAIGHASLLWPLGGARPLALALDRLSLAGPDGIVRDRIDAARLLFRPADLLALRLRPCAVRIAGGRLAFARAADGSLGLAGVPGATLGAGGGGGAGGTARLARLPAIGIDDLALVLAPGGGAPALSLDGLHGELADGIGGFTATLDAGGTTARVRARLDAAADNGRDGTIAIEGLDAAAVSALAGGGPVGLDGRLDATVRVSLAPGLALRAGEATIAIGAGTLRDGTTRIALRDGRARLALRTIGGGAVALSLRDAAIVLAPPGAARTVAVTATGDLAGGFGAGGRVRGALRLGAGALDIPTLVRLWPDGIARDARRWVATSLPSGAVEGTEATLALASRDGLRGLGLAGAHASLAVDGARLVWLAPIEPATGMRATIELADLDDMEIRASAGRMHGLDIAGTTMRISGLAAARQRGVIDLHLRGAAADLGWVLSQPRLHLRAGSMVALDGLAGRVEGEVRIGLPLDDRVTMDGISIGAEARFTGLAIPDVALGRPLEDGRLSLRADRDGLSLVGDARFAALPVSLAVRLDFRDPAPGRPEETAHVATVIDPAAFARAVPPALARLDGAIAATLDYRAGGGTAAGRIGLDLSGAALRTGFGWNKPAGAAGRVEASFGLDHGRLTSAGPLRARAPGLSIEAAAAFDDRGIDAIAIERLAIGATEASGRIGLPRAGGPAEIALRGPRLDLAPLLAASSGPGVPQRAAGRAAGGGAPGPGWRARLRFGEVVLAKGESLAGVAAEADGRGAGIGHARVSAAGPGPGAGASAPAAPLVATVAPAAAGRALSLRAADAGAWLAAFGVTDRIRGGTLAIDADAAGAGWRPLDGTASLTAFAVRRAPLAARLLRDATLYGLADRAGAGRLSVTAARTGFHLGRRTLRLSHLVAFQPALGITASGAIGLAGGRLRIRGAIVPAWSLNTLPGRLPLIGRLFRSAGGGVFDARFRLDGTLAEPAFSVDPLAALLPGVLGDALPR